MGRIRSESNSLHPAPPPPPPPPCLSRTASSPSPSSDTNHRQSSASPWSPALMAVANKPKPKPIPMDTSKFLNSLTVPLNKPHPHNLELQLLTTNNTGANSGLFDQCKKEEDHSALLQLSIGSSEFSSEKSVSLISRCSPSERANSMAAARIKEEAREQLATAMAEKAYAEEARRQAKRQMEFAEQEFANAKRIRQQAQTELEKAVALKEQATKQINATLSHITCNACKEKFQASSRPSVIRSGSGGGAVSNEMTMSYISSSALTVLDHPKSIFLHD